MGSEPSGKTPDSLVTPEKGALEGSPLGVHCQRSLRVRRRGTGKAREAQSTRLAGWRGRGEGGVEGTVQQHPARRSG